MSTVLFTCELAHDRRYDRLYVDEQQYGRPFNVNFPKDNFPKKFKHLNSEFQTALIYHWQQGGNRHETVYHNNVPVIIITVTTAGKSIVIHDTTCRFAKSYIKARCKYFNFKGTEPWQKRGS